MSAAGSRLRLEPPAPESEFEGAPENEEVAEREALEKLTTISPPSSSGPVIAIDLDDVLSQTNQVVADCEYEIP
jgi:hypothetical protein